MADYLRLDIAFSETQKERILQLYIIHKGFYNSKENNKMTKPLNFKQQHLIKHMSSQVGKAEYVDLSSPCSWIKESTMNIKEKGQKEHTI